ncbi:MAG: ABC transporter substrate-binding protein, partial [Planctomycetota bacterium]
MPFLNGCDASSDDRTQRVEFWTISLRPTFNDYMNERIEAFESEHPDIEIEWVDVPFDAINRKLLAAAAAGRAPDVVNLSDLSFARYAAAGAFADLSILPQESLESYHEGALALGTIADQQLALPWYLTTQAVMCNTVLLGEGGLTPESLATNWLDLVDQAGVYHARTGKALFTQPIGTDSQLPIMLFADNRPPLRVDEDGTLRANLTNHDALDFLDRFVTLYRLGALPREAASKGFEHLIEVYQDRRVALVNTGPNFLSRIKDNAPQVFEVTTVKPAITG